MSVGVREWVWVEWVGIWDGYGCRRGKVLVGVGVGLGGVRLKV